MQQLSPQDASFIYLETPATPMHVGSLSIYDPADSDNADFSEESVLRNVADRLHLATTTRRKCVRVPFEADYPYWVEDQGFDLEYHVRRVGLPKPGTWDELKKLTARIFSRPLDMSRPLWEMYIIDGLDNLAGVSANSFALLFKTHHAAVDGASGVHFFQQLHDTQPEAARVPPPQTPWQPEATPTDAELMFRTSVNNFLQPFRFMQVVGQQVSRNGGPIRQMTRQLQATATNPMTGFSRVPKTRFNGEVTPHRVFGTVPLRLDAVRRIKKQVPGATVNDVILALCGGALRAYLASKNELDDDSLVAMAPVNLRKDKGADPQAGNSVGALFVPLGTHIEDPFQRLAFIHEQTSASKVIHEAVGASALTDYSRFVPAYTAAMGSRLMSETAASSPNPPFNVSITNVPGPQVPLYFGGATMTSYLGLGPISQGMGLIMPILSYRGEISVSFTSCRQIIPDPEFFEGCISDSFEALAALTSQPLDMDTGSE